MIYAQMNSGIILLIIFGVAAAIALIAWIIYRFLHIKMKDDGDEKPTDEQILHEEMDRVLKPIDDDELSKKINDYKDDEDK